MGELQPSSSRLECLSCGCPAAIKDGHEDWTCPMCGNGFVRFVLGYKVGE